LRFFANPSRPSRQKTWPQSAQSIRKVSQRKLHKYRQRSYHALVVNSVTNLACCESIAMNPSQGIFVTGSRDIERETARTLFEIHLSPFLHRGRTWLIGGAHGVDEWALEWLAEHDESCWLVVPYTRAKQPRWIQPWFDELERVVELQLPRRKNAAAIRNRHLVDLSQVVFGFWSGKGGGTLKTLKYGLRAGREVHGIPAPGVRMR
jgi:predicted Rossmann fold nucleotide-binding protein DprA/Smf involved in DNA uptake